MTHEHEEARAREQQEVADMQRAPLPMCEEPHEATVKRLRVCSEHLLMPCSCAAFCECRFIVFFLNHSVWVAVQLTSPTFQGLTGSASKVLS